MDTLLKRKGLWSSTNNSTFDLTDSYANFSINVKKDEVAGVIMTYILREIFFHTSGIDYPRVV